MLQYKLVFLGIGHLCLVKFNSRRSGDLCILVSARGSGFNSGVVASNWVGEPVFILGIKRLCLCR